MKDLTITVRNEVADKFSKLSENEKRELGEMVNLLMEDKRTPREVMDDISKYAQEQELTPEILKQLLKEDY
jgi:predicted CopG family antitoxin